MEWLAHLGHWGLVGFNAIESVTMEDDMEYRRHHR